MFSGCVSVDCDLTQALSYCGPKEKLCNPGHEEAPIGQCKDDNKRCCRTACNGVKSYCFATERDCLSGHIAVEGKCPVAGFKCCQPSSSWMK